MTNESMQKSDNGVAAHPVWQFSPDMDLYESGDQFLVLFDVPGVEAGSMDVQLEGRELVVRARRTLSGADEAVGQYVRSITLPEAVDADSVTAELHHGVLEIRVMKSPEARRTKIPVRVG